MAPVAVKNASQLRSANAWPVPDEPAFMMIGRVPPNGFGLARTPRELEEPSLEVELPGSLQARLTTSIHSCANS